MVDARTARDGAKFSKHNSGLRSYYICQYFRSHGQAQHRWGTTLSPWAEGIGEREYLLNDNIINYQGSPTFWHLWGHTGRKSIVLGHTLNTQILTKTDEQKKKKALSKFPVLGHIHSQPGLHAAHGPWVGHPW